ncbi:MAG TPA: RNA polymerase sigma factor [Ktedonobacteraceae bacterium]|nr:RNA polymerase sigma factor [Ktedonobacteraceae bacterium]
MAEFLSCELPACFSRAVESEFAEAVAEQQEKVENDAMAEQQILAVRALQGDEEAFEDIFNHYRGLMFRTAYSIVKDRDNAEDAVQNAFIQAWQHLPGLREIGALRSWLMRIVVNQCISYKRRLARSTIFLQQALAEQETERAAQMAAYAEGTIEGRWDLAQAIEVLPARQQTVIVLHYYQGMTLSEMSEALQTSENTLKKRIQAALSNLRQVLKNTEMDKVRLS